MTDETASAAAPLPEEIERALDAFRSAMWAHDVDRGTRAALVRAISRARAAERERAEGAERERDRQKLIADGLTHAATHGATEVLAHALAASETERARAEAAGSALDDLRARMEQIAQWQRPKPHWPADCACELCSPNSAWNVLDPIGERDAAKSALRKYGQHKRECTSRSALDDPEYRPCSCGFAAATKEG